MDGKHIAIRKPPNSGATYNNYKGFFSIILLGLVDSNYKFIWVDIGGRGSAGDLQIWNESDMCRAVDSHIRKENINLPCPDPLKHTAPHEDVPYFFVGK